MGVKIGFLVITQKVCLMKNDFFLLGSPFIALSFIPNFNDSMAQIKQKTEKIFQFLKELSYNLISCDILKVTF